MVQSTQHRIVRQCDLAHALQCIQQFLDCRFAQVRIRRMRHAPLRHDLKPKRAFRSEHQFALGRLTVDQVLAAARIFRRELSAGAIALLADNEQQRYPPLARSQQRLHCEDHGRDDALGVARTAPPDEFVVFARGEKRRHGVDVRGKCHHRRIPIRQHVVAVRLHFQPLDVAAGARRYRPRYSARNTPTRSSFGVTESISISARVSSNAFIKVPAQHLGKGGGGVCGARRARTCTCTSAASR